MRWLIDASAARHSGALTHHEGLLPALDAALDGDRCTVLASPALAARFQDRLPHSDLEALDVPERFGRFASLNLTVRRRIRELRPDAVLCAQYAPILSDAPVVLRMTDAHLVDDEGLRRVLPFYTLKERLAWRLKRAAFRQSVRRATAVLCATRSVRDQLLDAVPTVDPESAFTAHYGPSPLLDEASRHPGPRGTRLLTMHASPRKNIETILNAMARPELGDWTLTVLADLDRPASRYTRFLADRIRKLGLKERVHSAGYIHDRHRLVKTMLDHDILVAPSRIESWSHTVVEAAGMGMPVVTSDIACHREVTDGAAWLVPPDDAAALAAAVREIAEGGEHVTARVRHGVELVDRYSWGGYAAGALDALRFAARRGRDG